MGVNIQVARCGRCGKPRGLGHTCVTSATQQDQAGPDPAGAPRHGHLRYLRQAPRPGPHLHRPHRLQAAQGRRGRRQAADRKRASRQQAAAKRKAAAQARRQKAAAAAAAKRRAAADRKRKAAAERAGRRKTATALRKGATVPAARTRSGQHGFRACTDAHCERPYCLIWKEALRDGQEAGYQAGYEKGYEMGRARVLPRPARRRVTVMAGIFLIALTAFACWAVSVYVYPFRHCGRCGGTGRKPGSTRRRFDLCRRCSGTGRVQRIGSRSAHRAVLSVRSEIARERQRRRDRKADERATPPRRLNRP